VHVKYNGQAASREPSGALKSAYSSVSADLVLSGAADLAAANSGADICSANVARPACRPATMHCHALVMMCRVLHQDGCYKNERE
jgi:hypothetical protein